MRLIPNRSLNLTTGDFAAHVGAKGLNVPVSLFQQLEAINVHTAQQFVTACQSATRSLAMVLDWPVSSVEMALKKLTETLEGHVSSGTLHPGPLTEYNNTGCTMTDEERDFLNEANRLKKTDKAN